MWRKKKVKHTHIIVDVESDGPLIGQNSMVCFAAVVLDRKLDTVFYGQIHPISNSYKPEALAISGFTREEHEGFQSPALTMQEFLDWLCGIIEDRGGKVTLWSDNNGYDFSWINYYLLGYVGTNPFGWSSRRIGDVFCGATGNLFYQWKKHRDNKKYPHNHDPLSDALGNASAMLYLNDNLGFKLIND